MNRNETVWNAKSFTVLKVVSFAKHFLQQWRVANHSLPKITVNSSIPENDKWKPPTTGSFKLNIDAAIFENQRKAGLGVVIRNDLGSFIAAKVVSVQGIVDPLLAETLGVREAFLGLKLNFLRSKPLKWMPFWFIMLYRMMKKTILTLVFLLTSAVFLLENYQSQIQLGSKIG
ncbi:unnamed protein product [Fraxinus pennsylvanica]|uniref:RNase H type-1 domain-containing protein n=1 Tax=Fraxinus pennsylvanica TaxID=56036 RepID=A0AAD1YMV5_9LAMI|nr:unnamed protein product [Fraxinus pennsylvanica]